LGLCPARLEPVEKTQRRISSISSGHYPSVLLIRIELQQILKPVRIVLQCREAFCLGSEIQIGLDKNSARSVAFEVGLQNGAMASGLAAQMGKLGTIGLAAAIFSPWMNMSGSILANYWRKRPVVEMSAVQSLKSRDVPAVR